MRHYCLQHTYGPLAQLVRRDEATFGAKLARPARPARHPRPMHACLHYLPLPSVHCSGAKCEVVGTSVCLSMYHQKHECCTWWHKYTSNSQHSLPVILTSDKWFRGSHGSASDLRSTPVIAAARETHTTDGGRCVDAHRALQHCHTCSLGASVFVTSLGLWCFNVGVPMLEFQCWSSNVGVSMLVFQCWCFNVGVQRWCLCFSKGFLEKITIGVVGFLKTLL